MNKFSAFFKKFLSYVKSKRFKFFLIFLIYALFSFSLGYFSGFLSGKEIYTASADAVSDEQLYDCKFNPMSRGYVTFAPLDRPSSEEFEVAYTHSFPSALGGYVNVTDVNAEAVVRHQFNQNLTTNHPTPLNYHLIYADGRETISFSRQFYKAVGDDVINYNIGFVDSQDVRALGFYQWCLPLNLWNIETILTYRDSSGMLITGSHTLDVNNTIEPIEYYPIIPRNNIVNSWGYVNLAYLISRCRDSMSDDGIFSDTINDRDVYSLDITFRLRDTMDTSSQAVIYVNQNLEVMRDFHSGTYSYNSLLNFSKDDDISVGSLFQPVEAFLSIEFFNGFTFGYLLLVVLGVSFFTLLIKVLKAS